MQNVQASLFDVEQSAATLRDKGITRVSDNNATWLEQCLDLFPFYYQDKFTGEDIRHFYEKRGLTPAHSNAWGALINQLLKKGMIKRTGDRKQMSDAQSHARLTDIYQKIPQTSTDGPRTRPDDLDGTRQRK